MIIYEKNIPEELIMVPNWVGWREINLEGKLSKIPIDPITEKWAKVNSSSTWSKFKTAVDLYIRRKVDGIGFVFSKYDSFIGIDLDDCFVEEERVLNPKSARIVRMLDSYTEISPSGKGLHIIIKSRNKHEIAGMRKPGFEVYPTGRFFTVTSTLFENSKNIINERHVELITYIRNFEEKSLNRLPTNVHTCPLCPTFGKTGKIF